jgi:hypothetical protein
MMNMHDEAPFSIAVALPTHLKSLVERMLHGVLRDQPVQAARWRLSNTPDSDVVLRLHGEDGQAISPNLMADVRRRDGQRETLVVEGAWRAGAMTAALDSIASIIVTQRPTRAPSTLALHWLQRWGELRAQHEFDVAVLTVGTRTVARVDLRSATAHYTTPESRPDTEILIAAMIRDGWSLDLVHGDSALPMAGSSLKPLLWQLGLLSGEHGALAPLRAAERLRLKGWPYLAAGGHPSYAELVKHLRNGDNDRASLQTLVLAPRTIVDGFLNACFVCGFFHDDASPARVRPPAAPNPRSDAGDPLVISAIRRTLGIARS